MQIEQDDVGRRPIPWFVLRHVLDLLEGTSQLDVWQGGHDVGQTGLRDRVVFHHEHADHGGAHNKTRCSRESAGARDTVPDASAMWARARLTAASASSSHPVMRMTMPVPPSSHWTRMRIWPGTGAADAAPSSPATASPRA